jgi:hypothetical protein
MGIITTVALVGAALADAPDPKPQAATVRTGTVQTVNGVQVVRVSVSGGWQWPTHKSNCNTNRTGAGYAIDWNDPNAGGNHVTTLSSIGSIDVGSTGNGYNPADNEVHPTRPEEAGSQFNDPGSPGSYAAWRSGCGHFNGTYNEGVWGAVDLATGAPITCTSATTPSPTCLGGSHVYTVSSLEQGLTVCSIMYDVHGGDSNKGGAPNGAKEITAGGSGHNGDNGAEKNGSTPLGNTCAPIRIPPPPTPTPTPTATPTATPTCPGGMPRPSSGFCASAPPTPTPTLTPPPSRTPTTPPDLRCPVGTTKFTINGTNSANYTDFTFTVSATYTNGRSLDFTSNLGVRELLLNGSGGVNRYQFDPAIKLGNRFEAAGGHTITQTVFCYVKNSPTPTPTPTRTPTPPCNCATPTPTPPPCTCPTPTPPCSCTTTVVNDPFTRETGNGWGSAPTGGAYTMFGSSGSFSVDGSAGHMLVGAGVTRGALLDSVSRRDVDIKFRVSADKPAMGGKNFVYAVARRIGNNEYRPRLIFNPDGTVSVNASILVNGVETSLGTPVVAPGVTQSGYIWFRATVTGSSPTTIKVKAWSSSMSEPSGWLFTTTNSNSACQSSGGVGLRVYVNSTATNAPIDWKFDDYRVLGL